MDQIYMSSYLTISADTSPDTRSGFLHDRNMLGYTTCVIPTLLTPWTGPTPGSNYGNDSSYASLDKSNLTGRPIPQVARAVCCGVAPAKVPMDSSILSDRGWILQETILSRKLLHWSGFEVSWECNECVASDVLHQNVCLLETVMEGRHGVGLEKRCTTPLGTSFGRSCTQTPMGLNHGNQLG
jgi:hypothetical protein